MSDRPRRGPRKLGGLVREVSAAIEPKTPLARVQASWEAAAGSEFAARCRPVGLREGTVTVVCESAVWAQELDLLQAEVIARLHSAGGLDEVRSLRVRAGEHPA